MEELRKFIRRFTERNQWITMKPEYLKIHDLWPPSGWPACPTPERFDEALYYIMGDFERFQAAITHCMKVFRQGQRRVTTLTFKSAPPRIRKDVEILMSEMISRTICMTLPDGPEEPGIAMSNIHPTDQFLAASRMTNQQSIGTVIIAEKGREILPGSYGVIHRDPDWMGLCWELTEVRNLEALVFCDETHNPDVIMAVPQKLLGEEPNEIPRCSVGRDLEDRGISKTLAEVFRHHGATPYFIDLCGKSEKLTTILANLLILPEE